MFYGIPYSFDVSRLLYRTMKKLGKNLAYFYVSHYIFLFVRNEKIKKYIIFKIMAILVLKYKKKS